MSGRVGIGVTQLLRLGNKAGTMRWRNAAAAIRHRQAICLILMAGLMQVSPVTAGTLEYAQLAEQLARLNSHGRVTAQVLLLPESENLPQAQWQDFPLVTVIHHYPGGLSLDISTNLKDLKRLAAHPAVDRILPEFELQPDLKQGLELIDATQVRQRFDGSGIAIALIDSGIDPTHPLLGGSAACSEKSYKNSKVLGGWDFGEKDPLPCDSNNHGTKVSGIAAGLIPSQPSGPGGDYIGGVAPGAGIFALKITKPNGRPGSLAYLAALRWVADHWNDDLDNPILVVSNSNSWNSKAWEVSCNDSTASYGGKVAAVLSELDRLGITVFNSAGNAGFKTGVQWPACMDQVQSVGSVRDTTAKVMPSSNSGQLLDFFAPANVVITTSPDASFGKFGTTSAAAPYAAGVAVVIQQAARELTGDYLPPAQLLELMRVTGQPVTDPDTDPAITRPLVNLANAIARLEKGL